MTVCLDSHVKTCGLMHQSRTRVLPNVHQEAVDAELSKRANKERDKRAKEAAKAAAAAGKVLEMDNAVLLKQVYFFLIRNHHNWRGSWTNLSPKSCSFNALTDILFHGRIEFSSCLEQNFWPLSRFSSIWRVLD